MGGGVRGYYERVRRGRGRGRECEPGSVRCRLVLGARAVVAGIQEMPLAGCKRWGRPGARPALSAALPPPQPPCLQDLVCSKLQNRGHLHFNHSWAEGAANVLHVRAGGEMTTQQWAQRQRQQHRGREGGAVRGGAGAGTSTAAPSSGGPPPTTTHPPPHPPPPHSCLSVSRLPPALAATSPTRAPASARTSRSAWRTYRTWTA